jgi:hypothetical protein
MRGMDGRLGCGNVYLTGPCPIMDNVKAGELLQVGCQDL